MALYQGNKLLSGVVINKDATSAFQAAQAGGYQGTEQEFNEFLANAEKIIDGKVSVGEDGKVPSEFLPEMDYASNDDIQSHIDNHNNPHNVTAEQIGVAENVVNAIKETGNWSVDGILTQLGNTMFSGETLYRWMKSHLEIQKTSGTGGHTWVSSEGSLTFYQSDTLSLDSDGTIRLVNPTTFTYATKPTVGYYYALKASGLSSVSKATGATQLYSGTINNKHYIGYTGGETWGVVTTSELAASTDPNAHYDGEVDDEGYTYTALDPIVAFIPRIQTGSYVGTGTFGASNPCTIPLSFEPKFVWIRSIDNGNMALFFASTLTDVFVPSGYVYATNTSNLVSAQTYFAAVAGNVLSWYGNNQITQMNGSGEKYSFGAIG